MLGIIPGTNEATGAVVRTPAGLTSGLWRFPMPDKRIPIPHICQQCGKTYFPWPAALRRGVVKFCSQRCNGKGHATKRPRTYRSCSACGKEFRVFPARAQKGYGKYCSSACYGLSCRRNPKPDSWTRGKRWRELRRAVWERDRGTCQVCLKEVPFTRNYHCGHIIDRRIGGQDTMENCVVMCRSCNTSKPQHTTEQEYQAWKATHCYRLLSGG